MNKKRLIITSVISIVLVAILLIGSTYSIFTTSEIDENSNVYTTGNLDITYTLSEDNIQLTNNSPMTEEEADSVFPYRITVTNSGTVPYMFDVILNDTTASNVIDYQYIMAKVGYLDSKSLSDCTDNVLKEDVIILPGTSVDIDVRIYLDSTISNSEIGKSFYGKLSIDGLAIYDNSTDIDNNILSLRYMNTFSSSSDYSYFKSDTYREKIKNVSFVDYIDTTNAIETWDMSESGDNSVVAWVVDNETEGYYDLYIGSKQTIYSKSLAAFFYYMSGIENINFNNLDTSLTTSMLGTFSKCTSLTTLDLSSFDTSNVTNMRSMFAGVGVAMNLTSLDLSGFDTSNVTDMRAMFQNCGNLTSLDLSNFDTSKVTTMRLQFNGCNSLTTLNISNFDTGNVTDMAGMFQNCNSLTTLDVSNFDTSNVTDISYMFNECNSLTNLNVSDFNTSKVTNMKLMFSGCNSLTTLDVSNFDTSNVTDMSYMFVECSNLTTLDVSNFNTSKVTDMGRMFRDCEKVTELDVSGFDTSNVTNMTFMFGGCYALTELNVSNFVTSKVTDMSHMFSGCNKVTSLDVSNFDTSNVTDMTCMFNWNAKLTSLDLSNFNTEKVTSMNSMFNACENLTTLNISNFDTSSVTNMSAMFKSCPKLTTTFTVMSTGTTTYTDMFSRAATEDSASITVNYTSDTSTLVDSMIATKSDDSNVAKGSLVG